MTISGPERLNFIIWHILFANGIGPRRYNMMPTDATFKLFKYYNQGQQIGVIHLVVYKNSSKKLPVTKDAASMGSGMPAKSTTSPNSQRSKPKTKEATKRQSMLNTHKLAPFKYDMNEILSASQMDEAKASAFLASLIAKASRQSTREAKEFVKTYLDSGDLSKEEFDKICKLMDKYSKYR